MAGAELARLLLWWILAGSVLYLLVVYALATLALGRHGLRGFRSRESQTEDPGSLAVSRFTIPVSLLVPAYNEEALIVSCVRSLLDLNYPELELIVVSDGSVDGTLERLKAEFDLRPREVFYRRVLPTGEVRRIYRSAGDSRLIVVDKVHGGKGDALNCAVNLARYRYVCAVAADSVYRSEALLRTMPAAIKDPAHVIGVTAEVDVRLHPGAATPDRAIDRHVLGNFQHIERLLALMSNRLFWDPLGFKLGSAPAFGIWRRDTLIEVGGFAGDRGGDDVDVTFKVQQRAAGGAPGRVVPLAEVVGATEAPDTLKRLLRQRARWHRVALETAWRHRDMLCNPRLGGVGLVGMPYFVAKVVVTPAMEALALATAVLAVVTGVLAPGDFVRVLAILALGNGILIAGALLLQESSSHPYSLVELGRLMLLGPFELVVYRPLILAASLHGTWKFLAGDRSWDKLERNSAPRAA